MDPLQRRRTAKLRPLWGKGGASMSPDILKLAGLLLICALAWLICDMDNNLKPKARIALAFVLLAVRAGIMRL